MDDALLPPFSARNRGAHAQIDNDCPETTRIGLLHLIHQLVASEYVGRWEDVAGELQRIARVAPGFEIAPRGVAQELLATLAWDKVFDFCERLYGHLAREV